MDPAVIMSTIAEGVDTCFHNLIIQAHIKGKEFFRVMI